jgi:hypothetical protein
MRFNHRMRRERDGVGSSIRSLYAYVLPAYSCMHYLIRTLVGNTGFGPVTFRV